MLQPRVDLDTRSVPDQILIVNCIAAASFAFFYYDYFLTLSLECSRFWTSRRITLASSLFYLNRYLTFFGHFPIMIQYFWLSADPNRTNVSLCVTLSTFHQYLAVAVQTIVGILLIIRTYALYGCKRSVLVVLCIAGLSVIVFGTYCVTHGHGTTYTFDDLPARGCLLPVSDEQSRTLSNAWIGLLCFDIMIFTMTLYKSLTAERGDGNSDILYIMLRDGTIYFFIIMLSCISVIVSFHYSPTYEKGATTILTNVLSSQMISRLQLNIRDPRLVMNYHPEDTEYSTTFETTRPIFTSIIGTSMGDNLTRNQSELVPMDTLCETLEDHDPTLVNENLHDQRTGSFV